jgi:hypothetical protein
MKESKSVLIGSLAGRNEPPAPIGCHAQQSEPIGDKDITAISPKSAGYAGQVKYSGENCRKLTN